MSKRYTAAFSLLIVLLVLFMVLNVAIGSVSFTAQELIDSLLFRPGGVAIIQKIRYPRMISALLMGGALSVSGFLLQTFFGNPIAGLYAAGEVAGTGMYGTQYPTCGTSIGGALFFGRIAGRAVTNQALL